MEIKVNDVNITLTKEQIEQIIAEDKASKAAPLPFPQKGEEYWYCTPVGECFRNWPADSEGRANAYRTIEEAESAYQLQLAKDRLRHAILVANDDWTPDFTDVNRKYLVEKMYEDAIVVGCYSVQKLQPTWMYMKERDIAKQLLSDHRADWKLVLGE